MAAVFALARAGDVTAIRQLLASDPAAASAKQWWSRKTPLHIAVDRGHAGVVDILLQNGADVAAKDRKGNTPLHTLYYTPSNSKMTIANLLLAAGCDVADTDKSGRTPLHMAALNGDLELCGVLIERGGNVNAAMRKGATPLHFASVRGFGNVVRLLLTHGADVRAKGTIGRFVGYTALNMAAAMGRSIDAGTAYKETIRLLESHSGD